MSTFGNHPKDESNSSIERMSQRLRLCATDYVER